MGVWACMYLYVALYVNRNHLVIGISTQRSYICIALSFTPKAILDDHFLFLDNIEKKIQEKLQKSFLILLKIF